MLDVHAYTNILLCLNIFRERNNNIIVSQSIIIDNPKKFTISREIVCTIYINEIRLTVVMIRNACVCASLFAVFWYLPDHFKIIYIYIFFIRYIINVKCFDIATIILFCPSSILYYYYCVFTISNSLRA